MLAPSWAFAQIVCIAVFAAVVVFLGIRARRKDRREYQRFKRYRSTVRRQAMFRKWLRESFVVFGGLAVVILLLVWQFVPLLLDDVNAWGWVAFLRDTISPLWWIAGVVLFLVVPFALLFLARGSVDEEDGVPSLGDIQAMLPRNTAEVRLGALLSVNAGVVEELLFRLALPALLFGAFGNAVAALVLSALLFGALHAYQGVIGILTTAVLGALLLALYVASGSILVPIVVHALIDLRSFVAIPLIVLRVQSAR